MRGVDAANHVPGLSHARSRRGRPGARSALRRAGARRTAPARSSCRGRWIRSRSIPAPASRRRATSGRSSIPPVGDAVSERPELRQHLVADLVATGPDAGADGRRRRADRLDAARDDPGGEPAPAAVEHRHPAPAGERHGQAVGDLDQRRQARLRRRLAVAVRSAAPRRAMGSAMARRCGRGRSPRAPGGRTATRSGSRSSAAVSRRRFSRTSAGTVPGQQADVEALETRPS